MRCAQNTLTCSLKFYMGRHL